MITKTQLIESLDRLPEKFTLDELMDRIVLIDKIERGDEQSKRNETFTEEELDQEMAQWFK
jgi:hypothetical protein